MSLQTEQDAVKEYCYRRALHRPDTTAKVAIVLLLATEVLSVAIAFLIRWLFHPSVWQSYFCGSVIAFALCLKKLLITAIELYQHYASEEVRRRCRLMPTCSEYAILALRKYGVIKGLYKIYVRLTQTCRGGGYQIDYP